MSAQSDANSALITLCVSIVAFLAWVTHIYTTFKLGAWVLFLFGMFVFPVGIIHGVGVWLDIFPSAP